MAIEKSETWDKTNLAHRYTVSFFSHQYKDDSQAIFSNDKFLNKDLTYLNTADSDNSTEATICAGLLVAYIQAQGIPFHEGKKRAACLRDLIPHLTKDEGHVLYTADIIDHYFKFLGE
jgi:hypothetical protein